MIGIYEEQINNIPSLIVVEADKAKEALPVITYFHGFTSAKEHNLPLAFLLAEKGYRVILPDSKYHGAREQEVSSLKRQVSFWEIVIQNVKELKDVKEYLDDKGLVLNDQFGIAGTSMGGITTSAALTQYPWIKTAAILMGSPKITTYAKTLVDSFKKMGNLPVTDEEINSLYEQLKLYDLSERPEKLNQRPLLFWHGEDDPVVPFDHSYTFYEQVAKDYMNPEDIVFLKEANRGHKVGRYAILETVKWFDRHL
ncbi:MAG: prolyl oligopeptidase family serine peptidase [Bacillota bacterium]|uniref:Prolyl oligopeptidase family serine peptidase n=1 Tax=Virgibacillus salarius TaxID=447199 RepID=A0A941DXR4_9BACI|nr:MULTISPECIES: prolyl oligopeptidase family serine peptidase [Bacillaceae]NAZ10339.1 prolyl oligopeptidase family serine peptidase [Agaribacter marinus]MBR7797631.1 prolyl oligopeptidase family serine peptidase [Virgibacillus salarius]MCC2251663.1 prolyl oligopeptidase family serine peptidase [Virgibacillus sp. AGTR]MDY7045407.1 prolyl oligopeptidase family serine peptidase [Virgibacillus sp. M23]QRZ16518.1 prolyl oligopeptidase family serine peptidase [Virgibacillus sp. AGTR]